MPIYSYECECGKTNDVYCLLKERVDFIKCDCSENIYMKRVLTSSNFKINGFTGCKTQCEAFWCEIIDSCSI